MSKNTFRILAAIAVSGLAAAIILYYLPDFHYAADKTLDLLIADTLIRVFASFFLVLIVLSGREGAAFAIRGEGLGKKLLIILPCFPVAIVNFPFSALITGSATVDKTNLVWLFVINCFFIAFVEEVFFRGLLQPIFYRIVKGKKFDVILSVLMTSAAFAAWHLVNLLSGASVGATLLQVVYTFLLGCMFSFMIIETGSVWWCVLAHAIFDVGGRIIILLGSGSFQDTAFWILTIVVGVLVGVYVFVMLMIRQKNDALKN